jgi:hypothetical protein
MRLDHYKKRAAKKGLEFNLTIEWLIEKLKDGKCEATGIPFKLKPNNTTSNPYYPSIDRIDSSKGYTKDNCQLVITAFNNLKSDNDMELVLQFAKNFTKIYEEKNNIK